MRTMYKATYHIPYLLLSRGPPTLSEEDLRLILPMPGRHCQGNNLPGLLSSVLEWEARMFNKEEAIDFRRNPACSRKGML